MNPNSNKHGLSNAKSSNDNGFIGHINILNDIIIFIHPWLLLGYYFYCNINIMKGMLVLYCKYCMLAHNKKDMNNIIK